MTCILRPDGAPGVHGAAGRIVGEPLAYNQTIAMIQIAANGEHYRSAGDAAHGEFSVQ